MVRSRDNTWTLGFGRLRSSHKPPYVFSLSAASSTSSALSLSVNSFDAHPSSQVRNT